MGRHGLTGGDRRIQGETKDDRDTWGDIGIQGGICQ